jgi:uncharacterized protein (DUF1330 family)
MPETTPAFAVALLRDINVGPDILDYLRRIDDTLSPYGGRFRVHGGPLEVLEGDEPGAFVLIEFPDRARAEAWYGSAAYQAILPLRTRHADSAAFLVDAVPDGYRAAELAETLGG